MKNENKTKLSYRLSKIIRGKPFFGEVILEIKSIKSLKEHKIIEIYDGTGFTSQGCIESIPEFASRAILNKMENNESEKMTYWRLYFQVGIMD